MSLSDRDRLLGMDRPITRRDFLNGVALATAGLAANALLPRQAQAQGTPAYPPKLEGLRGHSDRAMNIMHAVRDGTFWDEAPGVTDSGEHYDLVVVGGGISGLAAARLFQRQKPGATILILENNDDFGGHARRNEFVASNGKTIIGYGGSQSLQTPSYFSPLVKDVLADIGIAVEKFEDFYDQQWHEERGLGDAILFRGADWGGEDRLVVTSDLAADWVGQSPLNEQAKADLIELIDSPPDYLPGKTRAEKFEILAKTSYADFLLDICGYDPQLVQYFQHSTEAYFGMGIEGTTALDAWGNWNPGFDGMDLGDMPYNTMSPSGRLALTDPDPYIYHFPDGNAGVARALVRTMMPAALPGTNMEDLVTTPVNYELLDVAGNDVRLWLNASVVRVKHDGAPEAATSVVVTYLDGETLKSVAGSQVVLACWHRVIPYLTDELGADQVEALNDQHKVPLIYTNVLLRNWEALDKAGIAGFSDPGGFWSGAEMDFPVSMGTYQFADQPNDPVLLHLSKILLTGDPDMSAREQAQAGRHALTSISFGDMEREIRDMLNRALGPYGFDAARDIEAITCNRWSHGYSLEYMRPWDQFWPDGPLPIETARQPWGRIAIANSDSGAYAYVHSAIDQAARAVHDLLGDAASLTAYSRFPGPPPETVGL